VDVASKSLEARIGQQGAAGSFATDAARNSATICGVFHLMKHGAD
jgi:hypothetical protein